MSYKIAVFDSYQRTFVATQLQNVFSRETKIYCGISHVSDHLKNDSLMRNVTKEMELEPFVNTTDLKNIDLFFISALLIAEGVVDVNKFKSEFGRPCAKVVAMSIDTAYLDHVREKKDEYGVDFIHYKRNLGKLPPESIQFEELRLLRFYLRSTGEVQQNAIFNACEHIRLESLTCEINNNYFNPISGTSNLSSLIHMADHGSVVHSLIRTKSWLTLFEDPTWKQLINIAKKINTHSVRTSLALLGQFFSEEMTQIHNVHGVTG